MKIITKIIILTVILTTMCACGNNNTTTTTTTTASAGFISSTEINEIISENNYVLLDVRTIDEYNESHLENSINIPYDEISSETITFSKDKKVLVYCRSGKRAEIAVSTLKNLGYDAYNMGGLDDINLPKTS